MGAIAKIISCFLIVVFTAINTSADMTTGLKVSRPEWFGAVGNLSVDDGPAIRDAYAALGEGVLLLTGDYLIDSADSIAGITLVEGKFICGNGQTSATLKAGPNFPSKPILKMPAGLNGQHIILSDFLLVADPLSDATAAIELDTAQSSIIENIKIQSIIKGAAIKLTATTPYTAYFNQIINPYIFNCKIGIEILSTATNAPNCTIVSGGEIRGGANSVTGVKIDGADGEQINGCYFNGLDIENTFSGALLHVINGKGNVFNIRTEPAGTSQTLKMAGITTLDNNAFNLYQAESISKFGKVSTAKARLINDIYSIVTPANVRLLHVFSPNDAKTTETDLSTIGGGAANTTIYRNASLEAIAPPTSTPSVAGENGTYFTGSGAALFNIADSDGLSFGNGSADSPFSIVSLVAPYGTGGMLANSTLLAKADASTNAREYYFFIEGNKLYFRCHTPDGAGRMGRHCSTSIAADYNTWHTYTGTKSDGVIPSAIKIYRDGLQIDDTDYTFGSYAFMNNTTAVAGSYNENLGGTVEYPFTGKYGVVLVVAEELTAVQVARLDVVLRGFVGAY